MTPERFRELRASLVGQTDRDKALELLAEIDRLRALPVIATCGECGWHVDSLGARDCGYPGMCGAVGSVESDPAPPAWCPLRGAR